MEREDPRRRAFTADAEAFAGVAAGLIDIAEVGGDAALPDGVQSLAERSLREVGVIRVRRGKGSR